MIKVINHHYSVHVPGRYSPRDNQGELIFLVKHSITRPERIKNIEHTLSKTGETVKHDRMHYGEGAEAISLAQVRKGSKEFEITGHDLIEPRELPGHLPLYAGGSHSIHIERRDAINALMKHIGKTGLTPAESDRLKKLLEDSTDHFWGREY